MLGVELAKLAGVGQPARILCGGLAARLEVAPFQN
jgi:hypothetical protein